MLPVYGSVEGPVGTERAPRPMIHCHERTQNLSRAFTKFQEIPCDAFSKGGRRGMKPQRLQEFEEFSQFMRLFQNSRTCTFRGPLTSLRSQDPLFIYRGIKTLIDMPEFEGFGEALGDRPRKQTRLDCVVPHPVVEHRQQRQRPGRSLTRHGIRSRHSRDQGRSFHPQSVRLGPFMRPLVHIEIKPLGRRCCCWSGVPTPMTIPNHGSLVAEDCSLLRDPSSSALRSQLRLARRGREVFVTLGYTA
ncbi:hypothetical protein LZ31DRAFT_18924 [Colletotrichum somersetense]|nr:hypothetical protein LZ31DRAFT_18924 [Colletotrichum somersetense]